MLQKAVERILESHDFVWCEWHGCFDVAARKKRLLLLKLLDNVDSFMEQQAENLKMLSQTLEAHASLVGTHTRCEELEDNVIYERFDVPTFTPETLDCILSAEMPFLYRRKGGFFSEVDPQALRRAREEAGLSQSGLAEAAGISKKSVYEHESHRMKARRQVADKLGKILGAEITIPYSPSALYSDSAATPQGSFEASVAKELRRKGFATDFVHQSPFNLVARERFLIVSEVERNLQKIRRRLPHLSSFSEVSRKPLLIITEKEIDTELPQLSRAQLPDASARQLKRIVGK